MFHLKKTIFVFVFIHCVVSYAIENSIVDLVVKLERIEKLPHRKYDPDQYLEIRSLLEKTKERIRLVSYNILFHLNDYKLSEENRWHQRCPRILEILNYINPDIFGVQELYPEQLRSILPYLEKTYNVVSPDVPWGEMNAIFYNKQRFVCKEKVIWSLPSGGSKLHISETLTVAILQDLTTHRQFAVCNLHLPFSSPKGRKEQVQFFLQKVYPTLEDLPVLLIGDFNTFPNRPDLKKLPAFDGDFICRLLETKLQDCRHKALMGHVGPLSTFTNLPEDTSPFKGTGTPGVFLDHIFASDSIEVLIHAIDPATVNGHFPSDHMPVFIDFCIQ